MKHNRSFFLIITICILVAPSTVRMEMVYSSEKWVISYQTVRCYDRKVYYINHNKVFSWTITVCIVVAPSTVRMEMVYSSETWVLNYQTVRCYDQKVYYINHNVSFLDYIYSSSSLYREDGNGTFPRNVGTQLPNCAII